LLFLAQAIAEENLPRPIHLTAFTTGAAQVRDEVLAYPEKATLLGPMRVIPREVPGSRCPCAIWTCLPPRAAARPT
jgi:hypothetical protein